MTDPSDDLFALPGTRTDADGRHALSLIGAVDPALLDLVDLSLAGQDAVVIRAGFHFDEEDGGDEDEEGCDVGDDSGDLVCLVSHSSADGFDDDPVRLDARSWSPPPRTVPPRTRAAPPSSSCQRPSNSPTSCPA